MECGAGPASIDPGVAETMTEKVIQKLRSIALSEGLSVGEPIGAKEAGRLQALSANHNILKLLECLYVFDGLLKDDFYLQSEIRLWNSKEIILSSPMVRRGERFLVFADFSNRSEIYGFSYGNDKSVMDILTGNIISESCCDFYKKLSERKFDF